ncbi:MAG: hypothetical protein HDR05_02750 [Lachnospiraceae bacterium]|nr:hypothetical protein [Lachnospiraceae bacterium]
MEQIQPGHDDKVIVLGDLFDRGGEEADPAGVFFALSGLQGIRGNHDQWLADYIVKYFSLSERKRLKMGSYTYNSFDLIKQRMTEADMLNLADLIHNLPLQKEIDIDGKRFLLAHAMTSYPFLKESKNFYMMGNWELEAFFFRRNRRIYFIMRTYPHNQYLVEKRRRIFREGTVFYLEK